MTRTEKAVELFSKGFNCSQSVFSVFAEKYGISEETALKIGCGFGGGMRNGEICGAVSGAVMVIGLRYGHSSETDNESRSVCYQKTREFTEAFKSREGSIICRELLGIDIFSGDGMNIAAEKGLFKTTCVDMIVRAVELLEELGY